MGSTPSELLSNSSQAISTLHLNSPSRWQFLLPPLSTMDSPVTVREGQGTQIGGRRLGDRLAGLDDRSLLVIHFSLLFLDERREGELKLEVQSSVYIHLLI